jgi:endonuclease/exonuclease/phosphatase family metal-dependent hydrolase
MGDINDGFELDFYENRFAKSAVEILLRDLWKPEWVLRSALPRPKLTVHGWTPFSGRFKDRITGDQFTVLIDHILVSQGIKILKGQVWNPFQERNNPVIQGLKHQLEEVSDHFPVFTEIEC